MVEQHPLDVRPVVLIHRIRGFDLSVNSWLTQFRLLDPLGPYFSSPEAHAYAQFVRAILCLRPSPLTNAADYAISLLIDVLRRVSAIDRSGSWPVKGSKVYSDLSVDYLKMFLLNVPAVVVALTLFFFLDDLTGFEITYLLELPEPFSVIFTCCGTEMVCDSITRLVTLPEGSKA